MILQGLQRGPHGEERAQRELHQPRCEELDDEGKFIGEASNSEFSLEAQNMTNDHGEEQNNSGGENHMRKHLGQKN